MTPCEELGYKVGDKFIVVSKIHHSGREIQLIRDDGTIVPHFEDTVTCAVNCFGIHDIKPLQESPPENVAPVTWNIEEYQSMTGVIHKGVMMVDGLVVRSNLTEKASGAFLRVTLDSL